MKLDDKILDGLVRDYNLTKDKESAKQMGQKKKHSERKDKNWRLAEEQQQLANQVP